MKHFDRAALEQVLNKGVAELKLKFNLDLDGAQIGQLLDYLALLAKWNAVYNLTSVRDPMQMVTQHVLDSLAAVSAFAGAANVLDVGAGGGLPGMVLAIARPDMKVSMIDTVHKKTAFLTQVKAELGLANVTVHTMRVEQLQVARKFDVITSRA
ncbi:MAG TPA: 16S rRNA (guanine(527)-N(7))-methyltransferase RsmG, partial [Janthinobacterium sp.]|nr:16S rRNA (guanine(527)-N(7))-methyltransferase RsmG [Janthinobacterium sp.]